MKDDNSLHIAYKGFTSLGTAKKCRELIDLLQRNHFEPVSYDTAEGKKYKFNTDEFEDFWVKLQTEREFGTPFIKGKDFYASISWGGAYPYSTYFNISFEKFLNTDELLQFAKELFYWSEACYGTISLNRYKNKLYTPGVNITHCLGDITWANLFGKPYVDMWGEELLSNAPAWKVEKLNDGGYLLVASESPLTQRDIAEGEEESLKRYLGDEFFYKRQMKVQKITYEDLLSRVANPPAVTGYKAPDFKKYYV